MKNEIISKKRFKSDLFAYVLREITDYESEKENDKGEVRYPSICEFMRKRKEYSARLTILDLLLFLLCGIKTPGPPGNLVERLACDKKLYDQKKKGSDKTKKECREISILQKYAIQEGWFEEGDAFEEPGKTGAKSGKPGTSGKTGRRMSVQQAITSLEKLYGKLSRNKQRGDACAKLLEAQRLWMLGNLTKDPALIKRLWTKSGLTDDPEDASNDERFRSVLQNLSTEKRIAKKGYAADRLTGEEWDFLREDFSLSDLKDEEAKHQMLQTVRQKLQNQFLIADGRAWLYDGGCLNAVKRKPGGKDNETDQELLVSSNPRKQEWALAYIDELFSRDDADYILDGTFSVSPVLSAETREAAGALFLMMEQEACYAYAFLPLVVDPVSGMGLYLVGRKAGENNLKLSRIKEEVEDAEKSDAAEGKHTCGLALIGPTEYNQYSRDGKPLDVARLESDLRDDAVFVKDKQRPEVVFSEMWEMFESEVKLLQEDYNVLNTYNGKAPENCPERYRCYFEEDKVRTSSGGDVDEEMIREAREEERRVVAERLKKREARTRGQYRNNK